MKDSLTDAFLDGDIASVEGATFVVDSFADVEQD